MSGLLEPEYREVMLGRAEIRKVFKASKIGTIAGCYVVEGKIERDAGVRVVRDGIVVFEGKLDSLKRFKDDAKEVLQGYECGLAIEKFNEIQEGDVIEAFSIETIKRQLS
jgi:translation initiation factor IF-2